jgi:type IV secretory pathway TrbF-like protein
LFGRKKNTPQRGLGDLPSAPVGMYEEARNEFAEIYGSALVGQSRLFVGVCLMGLIALAAVAGVVVVGSKNTAVPVLVEVNADGGVMNKPVRIDAIRPNTAVVKAELSKFATKVFTIDSRLTPTYFREANVMTRGLATTQFTEFRISEDVLNRIAKEPNMSRTPTVTSVDTSQAGLAFVFLTTSENRNTSTGLVQTRWRMTLNYELTPPTTEAQILANPLGLFVTGMNIIKEGK